MVKHVVPPGGSVSDAGPGGEGWRFTSSAPSQSSDTDETNGAVNFETTGTTPTRITEHGRPGSAGYTFLSHETRCRYLDSDNPVPYARHADGMTVTPNPDDGITCDVYNRAPEPREELTVTKHASPGTFSHAGQVITYYYRVANTGNVTMHDIGVEDSRIPGTITSCGHRTLEPGHYTICQARYVITPEDVERGHIINFAHAIGKDPEGREIASAETRDYVGPPEVPVTG